MMTKETCEECREYDEFMNIGPKREELAELKARCKLYKGEIS